MKNLLKKITEAIDGESLGSIDETLEYYKKEAFSKNINLSQFDNLELHIKNTTDDIQKHDLKVNLKRQIQELTIKHPDSSDNLRDAW